MDCTALALRRGVAARRPFFKLRCLRCPQEYAGLPSFCRSQVSLRALNVALAAASAQCGSGAGFTADSLAAAANGTRGGRAAVSSLLKLGRARATASAVTGAASYRLC